MSYSKGTYRQVIRTLYVFGQVAQMQEHRINRPGVGGSSPSLPATGQALKAWPVMLR